MNIQIFGIKKSQDTRKAGRFFKERGIRFQSIDLREKGMSKRELNSVVSAVGGLSALLDEKCRNQNVYMLVRYLVPEDKLAKVLENQDILRMPIVRNGRQATVGYQPDVWKNWS